MAIDEGNGASGSLGPVIYYMRKGKRCMRSKPAHMSNPNTVGQKNHRDKLKLSGRIIKALRKFIDIGFQATELDMPMNEARQYMIKNCFYIEQENTVLDYSKVLISRGELKAPEEATLSLDGNTANITWKVPVKGDYTKGDDKLMVAMFIDEGIDGVSQMLHNVALRSDGKCSVPVPIHTGPLHIWIFFSQPDYCAGESRKKVSDSVYFVPL